MPAGARIAWPVESGPDRGGLAVEQQPIDKLAKWAFGTSLVVHSGPATVLGVMALRRIRREGTRGQGLAIAAIVIDVVNLLVGITFLRRRARGSG